MATGVMFADEYQTKLTQGLHVEPAPQYVFWQFVNEIPFFEAEKGQTVQVNGPNWLAELSDPIADSQLASLATKVADQTVQNFTENKQSIELLEKLLKNPLQLQEFDIKHAEHNVQDINEAVLRESYHKTWDGIYRNRLVNNTYRSFSGDATALANMDSADVMATDEFIKVAVVLADRYIPKYPDGNYIAVIDPSTKGKLLREQKFLDATTRGLQANAPVFNNEIGVYAGIRFVESNNIAKVSAGSPAFNVSQSFIFGTSLFNMNPLGALGGWLPQQRFDFLRGFGAGPLVKVVGMMAEARIHETTDYGRFREVIWIEHSECKVLDPKPGAGKTIGTDTRFCQTLYGATT